MQSQRPRVLAHDAFLPYQSATLPDLQGPSLLRLPEPANHYWGSSVPASAVPLAHAPSETKENGRAEGGRRKGGWLCVWRLPSLTSIAWRLVSTQHSTNAQSIHRIQLLRLPVAQPTL
ncbi:hypothetical protein VDGL01_11470 [Verticillium dahliae]